jgi:hypothetical protein
MKRAGKKLLITYKFAIMKNSQITALGITVDADQPTFMNLRSEKGSGQAINRNSLGFEMNCTLHGEGGEMQFFPTKTEAKKALVEKLK